MRLQHIGHYWSSNFFRGLHARPNVMDVVKGFFLYALLITDLFRKLNELWIHLPDTYPTYFRNIVYITLFIAVIKDLVQKRKTIEPIILAIVFASFSIVSIFLHVNLLPLFQESALLFFSRVLPAYCIARFTWNWAGVLQIVLRLRWLALFYAFLILTYPEKIADNYMPLAYNLLIPASTIACAAILKRRAIYWLCGVPLFVVMFVFGARGPILCFSFSVVFAWFVVYRRARPIWKFTIVLGLLAFAVGMYVLFDDIFMALSKAFPNSRTIGIIKLTGFLNPTGRDSIYHQLIEELWRSPIALRSLHGDTAFLSQTMGKSVLDGIYAHNFILEVLFDFGLPLGVIILGIWTVILGKSMNLAFRSDDIPQIIIYAVFVIGALPRMMISGSFVTEYSTWLAIGVMLHLVKQSRLRTSSEPIPRSVLVRAQETQIDLIEVNYGDQ